MHCADWTLDHKNLVPKETKKYNADRREKASQRDDGEGVNNFLTNLTVQTTQQHAATITLTQLAGVRK